jgi:hypothetical protein
VALFKGFTGVLQTDAYAAYRSLADPKRAGGPVSLAHCWSHCRREFFDLAKTAPAPIATEALKRIAEFYQIEAEIRGRSADQRQANDRAGRQAAQGAIALGGIRNDDAKIGQPILQDRDNRLGGIRFAAVCLQEQVYRCARGDVPTNSITYAGSASSMPASVRKRFAK